MAYWGLSFHSLDGANRLIVPARFRETLGSEIIVYRAVEGCLFLYDQQRFGEIAAQLDAWSRDPLKREAARMFFTDVSSVSVDRTGRIVLPAECIAHAGLGTEVALLGANKRIELWDKDSFEAKLADKESLPADRYPDIEM